MPRLVPANVPDGFAATGAFDLPQTGSGVTADVAIYARADDQAFAGPSIGVIALPPGVTDVPNGDVEVNGHPASLSDEGGARVLAWIDGDSAFRLQGRQVGDSDLLAAAESVRRASGGVEIGSPPAGLVRVAQVQQLSAGGGLSALGSPAHAVGYQASDGRTIEFITIAGGDDVFALERYFLIPGGDRVEVRGHEGFAGTTSNVGNGTAIIWQETNDAIGIATATGVDRDTLLDVADGLRPATDDEWGALLAKVASGSAATTGAMPTPPPDALGSFSSTYQSAKYTVYVNPNGELQFTVQWDGGGLSLATGNSTEDAATPNAGVFGFDQRFGVFYGKAPTSVDRVRLELPTGDSTEGSLQPVAGQSFGLFAIGLEVVDPSAVAEDAKGTAIFLDAAGNELSRQSVTVTAH
jgi:hypothetical protein